MSAKLVVKKMVDELESLHTGLLTEVVEIENPSRELSETLAGIGYLVNRECTIFCRSETCQHFSHDSSSTVYGWKLPSSLLYKQDEFTKQEQDFLMTRFNVRNEDQSILLLSPDVSWAAVTCFGEQGFANTTKLVKA